MLSLDENASNSTTNSALSCRKFSITNGRAFSLSQISSIGRKNTERDNFLELNVVKFNLALIKCLARFFSK